jgi:hypothetical protein
MGVCRDHKESPKYIHVTIPEEILVMSRNGARSSNADPFGSIPAIFTIGLIPYE